MDIILFAISLLVGLACLVGFLVLLESPTKREQIEQERLASEARISRATYAAVQRLFEESRRSSSPWSRP